MADKCINSVLFHVVWKKMIGGGDGLKWFARGIVWLFASPANTTGAPDSTSQWGNILRLALKSASCFCALRGFMFCQRMGSCFNVTLLQAVLGGSSWPLKGKQGDTLRSDYALSPPFSGSSLAYPTSGYSAVSGHHFNRNACGQPVWAPWSHHSEGTLAMIQVVCSGTEHTLAGCLSKGRNGT